MKRYLCLAVAVLAVLILLAVAGCTDPCAGHGGTARVGGGWSYCNDGTQQAG